MERFALAARTVGYLIGIFPPLAAFLMVWSYTEHYAIHFCKWPATISCSDGSGIWWLVPTGHGLGVFTMLLVLGAWARFGRNGTYAWLLVAWLTFFPFPAINRRFGTGSLVFFGFYGLIGLVVLAQLATAWMPKGRFVSRVVAVAIGVAYLITLAMLPSHLEAVSLERGLSS